MYNEFYSHKKNDTVKWIIAFTAIFLLAVFVLAANTRGFTDLNPYGWFGENEAGTDHETNPEEPKKEGMSALSASKIVNSDYMRLSAETHAVAPTSFWDGDYVTLVATHLPDNTYAGVFVWSMEWVNPNSSFASGKDVHDYVEMEGDENSNVVYVSALQAFGEQIKISVYCTKNPKAVAYCLVDYGQKMVDLSGHTLSTDNDSFLPYEFINSDYPDIVNFIVPDTAENMAKMYFTNGEITYAPLFEDIYSAENEDLEYYYTVTITTEFYNILKAAGLTVSDLRSYEYDECMSVGEIFNSLCVGQIIPSHAGVTVDYAKINAVNDCLAQTSYYAFTISVHVTSSYDSDVIVFYCDFADDAPVAYPVEIVINNDHVIL